jgi:hypothetical protein
MTWVLALYVYAATAHANIAPGDPGILMSPVVSKTRRIEIAMPSREVCEQIAALKADAFEKLECRAKDPHSSLN